MLPRKRGAGVRRPGVHWVPALCSSILLSVGTGCAPPDSPATAVDDEPAPAVEDKQAPAVEEEWERFSDPKRGIAFRYPRDLGTEYIHTVDWPPQVRLEEGPFTCERSGTETERAGLTEPKRINGRTYCVSRVTEGAAGSVYTMYAYATPAGNAVLVLTFSLRAVQCGNYDEERRAECESERAAFSVDSTIDKVVQSIEFSEG